MIGYGLALSGVLLLALLSRKSEIMFAGLVVLASWLAWCGSIIVTGDYEPWYCGIVIDSLAMCALLKLPSCKGRAAVAALFGAQVAAHVAYGSVLWLAGTADWQAYSTHLDVTGWLQLIIIGGWGGGLVWRRFVHWGRRRNLLGYRTHSGDLGAGR